MLANPIPISTQYPASVMVTTYGFHPRSEGLTYRMPARETVAGVAALTWPISNMSLMEGVRGTRLLLASVSTLGGGGERGGERERGRERGGGRGLTCGVHIEQPWQSLWCRVYTVYFLVLMSKLHASVYFRLGEFLGL